jgi:sortase (surface protein transpeptidase)
VLVRRVLFAALLFILALVAACGGGDENKAPTATPNDAGAGPQSTFAAHSIVIPSIGVDAPLTPETLTVGQALPSPNGNDDVALYDFSAIPGLGGLPGRGGNIVLSGRSISDVGCGSLPAPCPAVFVLLFKVAAGDPVTINWQGQEYDYQVVAVCNVAVADFGDTLYHTTTNEQVTMLTGAGSLSETGFSSVLIVIAKPSPRTAIEPCPAGTSEFVPPAP